MGALKPDYSPSSLPKTTIEHKPNKQQQLTGVNTNLSPQKISSPQQQQQLTATTNISSPKIIPPQQQQQPTGVDTISPQKISSQQQQQPTGVNTISPQKISSSQQQQQSPLPPITTLKEPPPVNRILDFSTPPKPTAACQSEISGSVGHVVDCLVRLLT